MCLVDCVHDFKGTVEVLPCSTHRLISNVANYVQPLLCVVHMFA